MDTEERARYAAVIKTAVAAALLLILPALLALWDIAHYMRGRSLYGTGWIFGTLLFWGFHVFFFAALIRSIFSKRLFVLLYRLLPFLFAIPAVLFVTTHIFYALTSCTILGIFLAIHNTYGRRTGATPEDRKK